VLQRQQFFQDVDWEAMAQQKVGAAKLLGSMLEVSMHSPSRQRLPIQLSKIG